MVRSGSSRSMGFDLGLADPTACFKRKNRWLFIVPDVCGEGVNALPPLKSNRPSISFKEIEVQHISETVYFPGKPEWKPITISLYDVDTKRTRFHPVFEWLKKLYDVSEKDVIINPSCDEFKKQANLQLLDGCGNVVEEWIYEGIWPQSVEFGDLDMSSSEVVTCDLTLRYDRAYIK